MRNLATDDNNDLYIQRDGRLAINENLEAVLQACEHAVKAQLGEMILATQQGMPNFQTIWNGAPNVAQFEAYLRATILSVAGVTEIQGLTIQVINGILLYQATIVTIYGRGALNG